MPEVAGQPPGADAGPTWDKHKTLLAYVARPTGRDGVDRVLQALVVGLLTGETLPGDRLNAARIAEDLDVSVVPVREALHLLAGQGIVELLPQRGARMRGLAPEEVAGWQQIFRVITLLALRMAAESVTDDPRNPSLVAEACDRVGKLPEDASSADIMIGVLEFHRIINSFSGADIVDEASRRLQVVHWMSLLARLAPLASYRACVARNYARMADAILASDPDRVEAVFNYHCAFLNALLRGERPPPDRPWIWRRTGLRFSFGDM